MKTKTKKYNTTDYTLAKQLIDGEFSNENIEDASTKNETEKLAVIIHKLKQEGIGDIDQLDLLEHDKVQDYLTNLSASYKNKMKKGGTINPKLKELKDKIAEYQFKYDSAKKNNLEAGMQFAQKKIDGLKKELETIEAELAKNAFKEDIAKEKGTLKDVKKVVKKVKVSKGKGKSKKGKAKVKKAIYTRETQNDVEMILIGHDQNGKEIWTTAESKDRVKKKGYTKYNKPSEIKEIHKKLSPNHELHKLSDTVYTVKNTKTDKAEFDIEKKGDKWVAVCVTKVPKSFDSLEDAIAHISKELSKGANKQLIEQKKKAIKRSREFRAKHPSGEITANETIKKAVEKAGDKLKEKDDKGESVEKQAEAIINQIIDLIKTLKKLGVKASDLNKIKKAL